jgi:hypothetical protein
MNVATAALFFSALPTLLAAQARLRITEVLVDPTGPNAGAQIVEFHHQWNAPLDLTGWHLAGAGQSVALPSVTLGAEQVCRVFLGVTGISDPANIYLPTMPALGSSDALAVLSSAATNDPNALVDFVCWGGGQYLAQLAVRAAQWPSTLVSAPVAPEGATLAHFGYSTFGSQDAPEAWFVDRTPTLGLPNDHGQLFGRGTGCLNSPNLGLGLARPASRPWIGEQFELDAYNLPFASGTVWLLGGASYTAPVLLDAFGMPGCALHVAVAFVVPLASFESTATFIARLPRDPQLTGVEFHAQAFVPWAGAGNAARALVTNSIVATIGSR